MQRDRIQTVARPICTLVKDHGRNLTADRAPNRLHQSHAVGEGVKSRAPQAQRDYSLGNRAELGRDTGCPVTEELLPPMENRKFPEARMGKRPNCHCLTIEAKI